MCFVLTRQCSKTFLIQHQCITINTGPKSSMEKKRKIYPTPIYKLCRMQSSKQRCKIKNHLNVLTGVVASVRDVADYILCVPSQCLHVYPWLNSPDCLFYVYRHFQSLEGKQFVHKHLCSCSQSAAHFPGIVVIKQYPCLNVCCDGCWSVLRAVLSLAGSDVSALRSSPFFYFLQLVCQDCRSVPGSRLSLVTWAKIQFCSCALVTGRREQDCSLS